MNDFDSLLREGIAAVKAGQRAKARASLQRVLRQRPNDVHAWLWLSGAVETDDERRECLGQVLKIDPNNTHALKGLQRLGLAPRVVPAPSVIATPAVPQQPKPLSQPPQATPVVASPSPATNAVTIIIIVLLVVLSLFWLGVGLLQLSVGLSNSPYVNTVDMVCTGTWNLFISVINLASISDVLRRYRRAVRNLMLLATAGSIFAFVQLLWGGAWIQVLVVPLYIVLGVLCGFNEAQFTELTPKELKKQERQLQKQLKKQQKRRPRSQ